ncbi:MAG: alpha-N-arabinofuranosidase 1, partial [Prevotella sp.]
LKTWEKVKTLLPTVESYYKACKAEAIGKALETANNALNNSTTFAENAKAMNDALVALSSCEAIYKDFIKDMADSGQAVDMTALMANPDFSKGSEGWTTSGNFTQANGYVAEYWNTWFSFYQTVENLPKGEYEVGVQSFYRYGSIDNALNAVAGGTEQLNAVFFANGESMPIMSLYDESADRYSVSPYSYPDNVQAANEAFNTYGYYKNTLKVKLDEPGSIKIGIENLSPVNSDWCCFDNFTLKYLGDGTGIDSVKSDNRGSEKTYTLGGMEIKGNAKTKGITIRNGKKEIK